MTLGSKSSAGFHLPKAILLESSAKTPKEKNSCRAMQIFRIYSRGLK